LRCQSCRIALCHPLENLNFDNSDARLPEHFYPRTDPSPLDGTHLISINPDVAGYLILPRIC